MRKVAFSAALFACVAPQALIASGAVATPPAEGHGEPSGATHAEPAAPAGDAHDEPAADAHTAPEAQTLPRAAGMPAAFVLAHYSRAHFVEDRAALMAAYARATDGQPLGASLTPAATQALLDLAGFELANVMLPEGLSILGSMAPADLPPEQALDWRALDLAMRLMWGGEAPDAETAALLDPGFAAWPDQPLFLAISKIAREDWTGASSHLHAAFERLAAYPPQFAEAVLPGLLEGAIEAELWALGRTIAEAFSHHRSLKDSSTFHFLLGLAAFKGGDMGSAFEEFVLASEGTDDYGQRARLAIVELGLATGTLPLEDARALLDIARNAWRGDKLELIALELLAQVDYDLGADVATLEALGAIADHFPGQEAADRARRRADAIIEDYYTRGSHGDLSLSEFLTGHRRIATDYRFDERFARQAERFADRFFEAGATAIAAEEYRATVNYMTVAHDLGLYSAPAERYDALLLKEAEALIEGGQFEAAGITLAPGLSGADPALHERFSLLRARVFAETGQVESVVGTTVARPSLDYLQLKAEALFRIGDWAGAKEAYGALWREKGAAFSFADAVNLLLAAYRAGDGQMAVDLATSFPDLRNTPHWDAIARGLYTEVPEVLPLKEGAARARVDEAAGALDQLRAVASGEEN